MNQRTVFFVSDSTGVTAEMLGHSLLAHFPGIPMRKITVPFVDTEEKARATATRISAAGQADGERPIILSTLINPDMRDVLRACDALFLDLFEEFISQLEDEFKASPAAKMGLIHSTKGSGYQHRIEAVNYALNHDDGITIKNFEHADLILIGVSRSGKTPTCLYLALQYGIQAANFPLTPDDFADGQLPKPLHPFRSKLYGLTITPERLQQIRDERRPDSRYASLENCRYEIRQAEAMFRGGGIPFVNTTTKSIEEIASTIMTETRLERRMF